MQHSKPFTGGLISVGQGIFCSLYGGKYGIVTQIHGEQSPTSCRSLGGGIGVTGGRANFDIIWDNDTESRHIPESLARSSVQWRLYDDVASVEEIAEAQTRLAIATARRKADTDEANRVFKAEKERLKGAYPELVLADKEPYENKRVAANLRILLKKTFPKVKFSVRSSRHGSTHVSWKDGPTKDQVEKITDKFKAGHFDGMEDCYKYQETPWTCLFGSVEYLNTSREVSEPIVEKAIDDLWMLLSSNLKNIEKPCADKVFSSWDQVPHLEVGIGELVRTLTNHWDALNNKYVEATGYGRMTFIVQYALRAQMREVAHA